METNPNDTSNTKLTDFSINKILNSSDSDERQASNSSDFDNSNFNNLSYPVDNFQWLNCTRYQPPKIPRSRKKETVVKKRKLSRNPRIPFSAEQIEILENNYSVNSYLNGENVIYLSKLLNLSMTRIKIWYQNRRAREKKEKQLKINESINSNNNKTKLIELDNNKA